MRTAPKEQNTKSVMSDTRIREEFSNLADDVLLNDDETASVTGLARNTLKTWRHLGRGPGFVRLGRACRYRVGTIREWLRSSAA